MGLSGWSWNKVEELAAEMKVAEAYARLYPEAVKDRARKVAAGVSRSERREQIEAVQREVENS